MSTIVVPIIVVGLAAVIAAVLGVRIEAAGIKLPFVANRKGRLALGAIGTAFVFIAITLWVVTDQSGASTTGNCSPALQGGNVGDISISC